MIKYKLLCKNCDLKFDSWFASSKEYEKLKKKKLLTCHICNSEKVEKTLMAPKLIHGKNKQKNHSDLPFENKIKVIQGVKVIDSTMELETLPRTWIWEDIGNYYGANPCGTVFNENILELYFESGKPGEPTRIVKMVPDLPLLQIENRVKASDQNKDLAYCFGGPYDRGLVVEGTIPANKRSFKVKAALQRPQRGLSYLIYNALKK